MRRLLIATAIALFVAVVGFERTTAGQGGACDRACLTGIAEQYIAAVIAKTPDKAGLATNVRMTENGQDLQIGEALWNSASGRGEYTLHVADPVLGSIVTFATMREGETAKKPVLMAESMRLAIDAGRKSFLAGRMPKRDYANASSPNAGLIE